MASRFKDLDSSDSDGENVKRVVKTAKDKRYEEMQNQIRNIANHKKIKDMSNVLIDFESLVKVYDKALKMNELECAPPFYIRCIAELEIFINDAWEKKKELNRTAARSLTALRQRVKKYNRDFEDQIRDFKEHPENYLQAETIDTIGDDMEADDQDLATKPGESTFGTTDKKEGKKYPGSASSSDESDLEKDDQDSDSDRYFDSDSSSLSSLSLAGDKYKDDPSIYFLKTTEEQRRQVKMKKERSRRVKPTKVSDASDKEDDDDVWTTPEPQIQAFEKGQEITDKVVKEKLVEVMASRGKKSASMRELLTLFGQIEEKIKEHHLSVGLHVKTLFCSINVFFDYDKSNSCMSSAQFNQLITVFNSLFDILETNDVQLLVSDSTADDQESLETPPFIVRGSIVSVVTLLDSECTKILQNANGHEVEYVERLRDERRVCDVLDKLCAHLEKIEAPPCDLCVAYLLKVEHTYYKFDFEWAKRVEAEGLDVVGENPSTAVIQRLCQYIYSHDRTGRLRTRAILCQIYHLALYDHWFKARDLMLMSNLQMSIEHADQSTMILYNRALVQLGLCAFRQGQIRDTHNALADLVGSGRIRELLAQGLHTQPRYERSAEDEKREQALQMPYHMYINTELIECVYHISAMLLEIPNLAAHETDLRWRPISKPFHLALRVHDRQTLVGPPETPRDHVLAAAKAMRYGNWKACIQYINNPKMDAKVWDFFFQSDRLKTLLELKIKEESLRSFLFTYSAIHDSISLDRLAETFELPKSTVYSIVSKMIINQELPASMEMPTDFLVMHKTERSRLQTLALQLSDKINSVVEMNEKLIESRASCTGLAGMKNSQAYQGPRRQLLRYAMNKFN